jgi:NAD-specific glutamate dehydrogenase
MGPSGTLSSSGERRARVARQYSRSSSIGQRRGGRFVHDALDVETRDAPRVLGGLTLRVVEVRADRDDGLGHLLAKVAHFDNRQVGSLRKPLPKRVAGRQDPPDSVQPAQAC